ncbi:hypothetical protein M446_3467 [Methylobacterium sp. 4-46]|uniref:hypothetical protein n=1 Tax=unclassified Methylobacterium TaxID=2615210 RepID=UPI000165C90A|nr:MULTISPECIES: hypothetical protein [Methylobacterium]ACA17852.1 hypothetical protein M446_3467 [Methylobacterium sp. 4-46]WFT77156.1 hypothetical protein QA634_17565 [Methylobacterium nodulans]
MLIRTVALLAFLAVPALAQQDYARPDLVRGLCQKDGCDEFSVVKAEPVTRSAEGVLNRTRVKTFHASAQGRSEGPEENGYVFCSPTRPAILSEQDGRTVALMIAPFAGADSRETVRRNANFVALYFSICHGTEAGKAAVRDLRGTAQSLGYRVEAPQSRFVQLKRAEDILRRD